MNRDIFSDFLCMSFLFSGQAISVDKHFQCFYIRAPLVLNVKLFSALFWTFVNIDLLSLFHINALCFTWNFYYIRLHKLSLSLIVYLHFASTKLLNEYISNNLNRVVSTDHSILLYFFPESTKITLAPSNSDVKVGENARMQCGTSHDPSLDITFIWSLDGRVIDLHKESQHYERTPVRYPINYLTPCHFV